MVWDSVGNPLLKLILDPGFGVYNAIPRVPLCKLGGCCSSQVSLQKVQPTGKSLTTSYLHRSWISQNGVWIGKTYLKKVGEFLGFWKVPVWHLLSCSGCRLYINFWRQHSSSFCHSAWKFHFLFMKDMESGFWCGEVWELLDLPFDPLNFGRNFFGDRNATSGQKEVPSCWPRRTWGLLWIVARWVSKRRIFITTWKCVLRSCSPLSTSCSFFCEDTFFFDPWFLWIWTKWPVVFCLFVSILSYLLKLQRGVPTVVWNPK